MSDTGPLFIFRDLSPERKPVSCGATFKAKRESCDCCRQPVLVDEAKRLLECSVCHRAIDPFAFMVSWAHRGWMYSNHIRGLERQLSDLFRDIAAAKKELATLKRKQKAAGDRP
jgi:predicted amidophosphoribosyltransferase